MSLIVYSSNDILTVARTLWGEARSEHTGGKIAIAWVIRNRLAQPGWWSKSSEAPDHTLEAVCKAKAQFSCWWDGQAKKVRSRSDEQLITFIDIVKSVMDGEVEDPTYGATHYHTILRPGYAKIWPPAWAQGHRGITIGRHLFYKIGLGG